MMPKRCLSAGAGIFLTVAALCAAASAETNRVKTIDTDRLEMMIARADRPQVITFMAAWCMPCIKELPDLNALHAQYKSRGLVFIGISLDLDGPQAIQPIIDKKKVQFPVYWLGEAGIEKFKIHRIPLIWLVRDGRVVQRILGQRSRKGLERIIQDFMNADNKPG